MIRTDIYIYLNCDTMLCIKPPKNNHMHPTIIQMWCCITNHVYYFQPYKTRREMTKREAQYVVRVQQTAAAAASSSPANTNV